MNSNTEWLPTKCRITKPPPPKPATNPLQFIKVTSCPLYPKNQEPVKKVEEVKLSRQDINDDAEEWQQNLDNWKSSRKKRQEHIIERVVEVKRLEEEEQERCRRKSKTFNEILKDRNKRGHKVNIPIYDDHSNDLSDYYTSNSDDKSTKDDNIDQVTNTLDNKDISDKSCASNINLSPVNNDIKPYTDILKERLNNLQNSNQEVRREPEYTYEGAIQDYRSRIKSKINIDKVFNIEEDSLMNKEKPVVSKINIYKRKEIFETEKPVEVNIVEPSFSKKLLEDFANSQSIKERLKSLEKCTDQSLKSVDKVSQEKVKPKSFTKRNKSNSFDFIDTFKSTNEEFSCHNESILNKFEGISNKDNLCCNSNANVHLKALNKITSSDDSDILPNFKNAQINCYKSESSDSELNAVHNKGYKSISSNESLENIVKQDQLPNNIYKNTEVAINKCDLEISNVNIISDTKKFLDVMRHEADINFMSEINHQELFKRDCVPQVENNAYQLCTPKNNNYIEISNNLSNENNSFKVIEPIEFNSVDIVNKNIISNDLCSNSLFAPPKSIEPPKEKPPPPPPLDSDLGDDNHFEFLDSNKRIKQEIYSKRSSFLRLDDQIDDRLDSEIFLDRPLDGSIFCSTDQPLEKSLYKKLHGSREICLSEVESQDSGLESERGRLSSDTWCSNFGDSSTPTHGRQDSEKTNSVTSEEDEITKKEREIIELVEKEEKSRNYGSINCINLIQSRNCYNVIQKPKQMNCEEVNRPYFVEDHLKYPNNYNYNSRVKDNFEKQDDIVFKESYYHDNSHSLENICDTQNFYQTSNYRKSLPDLQSSIYCKDYSKTIVDNSSYYYDKKVPAVELQCCKSMPDIQKLHLKTISGYKVLEPKSPNERQIEMEHRKSLPELQDTQMPVLWPSFPYRQSIKPFIKETREDENNTIMKQIDSIGAQYQSAKQRRPDSYNANSPSKISYAQKDKLKQPKMNASNIKSYKTHWLFHEAELRRLAEQKNNLPKKHFQNTKPIEPFIQNTTQRLQMDKDQHTGWVENNLSSEQSQLPYLNLPQTMGSASPVVYPMQDPQHKMLSVSGKKKCSYCENELGRGAAMIIESLCLFYHMECFKCCVCHIQLGDGLIGTDVRVRNQKLHCHNCYSSEDGVKFSCV